MKKLALFLVLTLLLAFSTPVSASIGTLASQTIQYGNGSQNLFYGSFPIVSANDVSVIYTDASGAQTTLSPSQYTVTIPSPSTGQLWANSFSILYPLTGPAIASGTSLTISRTIPLTQNTVLSNQGAFYPQVVEQALDTTVMQLQQIAARTGKIRGPWITGTKYNFGDIVSDGVNGADSGNYYTCAIPNTSGTWATDLAAGDWSLSLPASLSTALLPLGVLNGGTGATSPSDALANLGGVSTALLPLGVVNGGTGTTTAAGALTNLGAVPLSSAVTDIFGGATGTGYVVRATSPTLTTPNLGAATATSVTFSPTTGGILGTTTNDNATTGYVGEFVSSSIASGSSTSLTSGVAKNVTSITLTAGDWDVWGQVDFTPGSGTIISYEYASISATTGSLGLPSTNPLAYWPVALSANDAVPLSLVPYRVSVSTTTTIYLVAQASFSVSTCGGYGYIQARRRR